MTEIQAAPDANLTQAGPQGTDLTAENTRLRRVPGYAPRAPKVTRVVAARVSLRARMVEIWRSRELFAFLVRKEIKVKYKNSILGFLWSLLSPALTLIVYFLVFSIILKNGVPEFVIYLFSGLLAWNLFLSATMSATSAVVGNGGIVKKVAFPREVLALSSVGSSVVFFCFQSLVMVVFLLALWHAPAWGEIWLLVPALAAVIMFSAALGVFLSAINVYFRDMQHLVEVLLTAWFWGLPVVYTFHQVKAGIEHHHLTWIYLADPLVPVVLTFQRVLYNVSTYTPTGSPGPVALLPPHGAAWYMLCDLAVFVVSIGLFLFALVVFGRLEGNFAEEL